MGTVDEIAADEDDGTPACHIAQQQSEQVGCAAGLDHFAEPVAMSDMTHFMRQHAGDLIDGFRLVQKSLE